MPASKPKVALVHDRLNVRGGAERVLEELASLYPEAPIYTLIHDPNVFAKWLSPARVIRTSWIDRMPFSKQYHRWYLPFMPKTVEKFDLKEFDIIISSSAAFAHGVRTGSHQLHVSYIHSPMRYAWHQYQQHVSELGYGSLPIRLLLAYWRRWDRIASKRPDVMVANSRWTARKIQETFGRKAKVIYPPVHLENFSPAHKRKDYYLTVSRFAPYKRVDLIVRAFSALGRPLIVAGDGMERGRIRNLATNNVEILPFQGQQVLARLMAEARAFVYAAEEDFGIAAVEAQAAGCPVIAYGRGGLTETVIDGKTGIFFDNQSVDDIIVAIKRFETMETVFNPALIRKNAGRFSSEVFRAELVKFVETRWEAFLAHKQAGTVYQH